MKILLINHYAGSDAMGMEYRPFYMAREWRGDGHEVTLLASDFSHLRARQPEVRRDHDITEEDGVRFRWLRTNRYTGNSIGRMANILTFVGKLTAYAHRLADEERPDVVICSSTYPLDIYPGALVARRAGARLIFEVHDLWPLTPVLLGGYSRRHPYIVVLRYAEDWAYRHADRVVSLLPNARSYMVGRGLDPAKFTYIPNGVPISRWACATSTDLPDPVANVLARERACRRFLVGFAGGISQIVAYDTLLEAARRLAAAGIAFLLVGDGPSANSLRLRLTEFGLENVHMLGRIPKSSVQTFLSQMDVLVAPLRRSPIFHFGASPNKLFDYMFSGTPIVLSGDLGNDIVTEAKCGLTVEPEDPDLLASAILRLRELGESERRRLGENGRRFVVESHDMQALARRFVAAIGDAPH